MTRLHIVAEIMVPPHLARSTLNDRVSREVAQHEIHGVIDDIVEIARIADAFEAGGCVSIVLQRAPARADRG